MGMKCSKDTSMLCVLIAWISTRSLALRLPRTAMVKLNRLWTGVECFHLSMYKCGVALCFVEDRSAIVAPSNKP